MRVAEAQYGERPGEAIGEEAVSGIVEAPGLGLKGSWREAETWHHVAGSESLKRTQEAIGESTALPQKRPEHFGDASTTG